MTTGVAIRGVTRRFGTYTALDDVTLAIDAGDLVALVGPSGSGKSTLLRLIAGLDAPDSGSILLGGVDTRDQSARARRVGFVFQHYALFRHMRVFDNVAFGLTARPRGERPAKEEIRERVFDLLRLVRLDTLADRYPGQLSGGQRQRVAVARALAIEPRVLLLDEPFGALDANVRQELRRGLRQLQQEIGITTVLVTHDREEALEVANRVVVLRDGRIAQVGTPDEVYHAPADPFVYRFMGDANALTGRASGGRVTFDGCEAAAPGADCPPDGPVTAYLRPQDLAIRPHGADTGMGVTVRHARLNGPFVRVELERRATGDLLLADVGAAVWRDLGLRAGDAALAIPHNLRLFPADVPSAERAAERVAIAR